MLHLALNLAALFNQFIDHRPTSFFGYLNKENINILIIGDNEQVETILGCIDRIWGISR